MQGDEQKCTRGSEGFLVKELIASGSLRAECLPLLRLLHPSLDAFLSRPAVLLKQLQGLVFECDNQKRMWVRQRME